MGGQFNNDPDVILAEANYKFRHISSASGFFEYTTSPTPNTSPRREHDFTLPDLLALLRRLQATINPAKLTELINLITDHINNFNNPHRTTLGQLGTDVLQELYKEWLAQGNVGSEEDFIKVIFQYIKIADLTTTLLGQARDQVVSVYGLAKYVEMHDNDPDAHEALFRKIFPGDPIYREPSFCAKGYIGFPLFCNITRSAPLGFIDVTGKIQQMEPNWLTADYTYQDGCFPLVSGKNIITEVTNLTYSGSWTTTNLTINDILDGPDNLLVTNPDNLTIAEMTEDYTINPVDHLLTFTYPAADLGDMLKDHSYTVSCFVRPMGRHNFGIEIPGAVNTNYSRIHFNLENETTFIHHDSEEFITGGITSVMSNGWYRIWATFTVQEDNIPHEVHFYPIDIDGGDKNFAGTGNMSAIFAYPQFSEGVMQLPPYAGLEVNHVTEPTFISLEVNDMYQEGFSPFEGSFVFKFIPPNVDMLYSNAYLFELVDDAGFTVIRSMLPTTYRRRIYSLYNEENELNIGFKYSDIDRESLYTTFIFAYSQNKQLICSSGNLEDVNYIEHTANLNMKGSKLYFASNKFQNENSFLQTYVKEISYYPFLFTIEQARSFIGEM